MSVAWTVSSPCGRSVGGGTEVAAVNSDRATEFFKNHFSRGLPDKHTNATHCIQDTSYLLSRMFNYRAPEATEGIEGSWRKESNIWEIVSMCAIENGSSYQT